MSKRLTALFLSISFATVAAASDLPGVESAGDAPATWSWFGDLLLRANRTQDIPRASDTSFSTLFARGRLGVAYDPIPQLDFGAAIKLAASDRDNDRDRSRNFSERSNDVALDQFFLRWHASEAVALQLGKAAMPLQLSPMLWDADLRPIGASGVLSVATGDFDRLSVTGGYFAGDLPYGDRSRIGAVQLAWSWRDGAPAGGGIALAYLDFSDLDRIVLQGQSRTNRRVGTTTRLVSDYRLLDLQLVGRLQVSELPLEFRLDLVRNLGADDQRDGARGSVQLGDARRAHGWELGLAAQRVQRDAVMAAFNSDDWWFHSWARGVMPWFAYGFSDVWSARLAAFRERRDGVDAATDRVLLDLSARW